MAIKLEDIKVGCEVTLKGVVRQVDSDSLPVDVWFPSGENLWVKPADIISVSAPRPTIGSTVVCYGEEYTVVAYCGDYVWLSDCDGSPCTYMVSEISPA